MKTKRDEIRDTEKQREIWLAPTLKIFGTMRDLTKNIGTAGTGDISYEGRQCKSPGNCR